MKKTKITVLALGIIISAALLSGCSEEAETSMGYIDAGALANVSLPQIPAISSSRNGGTDNSTVSVDSSTESAPQSGKTAEINIPKAAEYSVCIAEFSDIDPEKIKKTLLGDIDITPEIIVHRDGDKSYNWKNENVSLCLSGSGSLIFLETELSTFIGDIYSKPNKYADYYPELFTRRNEALDFCSPEKAIGDVSAIFSELGIEVCADPEVYALHQSDLQEAVDMQCAEDYFHDFHARFNGSDGKLSSYTVNKSEECYYIIFNEAYNGIPIYNQYFSYRTIKDLTVFHPEITVVYSADGMAGLYINEYRGNISEYEKIKKLITPESAAQAVTAKYADTGIEGLTFDRMELMYVLTPSIVNDKINLAKARMIPAWVCSVNYKKWTIDRTTLEKGYVPFDDIVLIDAMTGAEII